MSTYKITYVAGGHAASDDSIAAIMSVVREEFPAAVYRRGKVYEQSDVLCERPIAKIQKCDSTAIARQGDRVMVIHLKAEGIVRKVYADGDVSLGFSDGDEGIYSQQEVTTVTVGGAA
jgi:hypothetical protein